MAANPNSSLVFDFPDPSPRFEFGDGGGGGGGGSPTKKGRRFGRLGRKLGRGGGSNGGGSGSDGDSPSKSTGTAATASLNESFWSSFGGSGQSAGDGSPKGNGSRGSSPARGSPHATPRKTRGSDGDIAGGPSSSGNGAGNGIPHGSFTSDPFGTFGKAGGTGGATDPFAPHFDLTPSPPSTSPKPGTPNANANGKGHARNQSSASGYISEVSEFSFDRVTVSTGATGLSSNVSWGFLDGDAMMRTAGMGMDAAVPSMDKPSKDKEKLSSSAKTKKHQNFGAQNSDSATFDNVSLSDDEELNNIPLSGVANRRDSSDSVVSEISELTEREGRGGGGGGANDAVRALLREGMEEVERKSHPGASAKNGQVTNPAMVKAKSAATKGDAPSRSSRHSRHSGRTRTTARSTTCSDARGHSRDMLSDLKKRYARFKSSRLRSSQERGSYLLGIAEDVQFCGLYFCGIDTTWDDGGKQGAGEGKGGKGAEGKEGEGEGKGAYEDEAMRREAERRRATENTFLGKVISCGERACGEVEL